jgi:hypothetical protein
MNDTELADKLPDPAHALQGRLGVVAELLCHLRGASAGCRAAASCI